MKFEIRQSTAAFRPAVVVAVCAASLVCTHTAQAWKLKTLHVFCSTTDHCDDGQSPSAGLTMDSAGNLYGTTAGPGTPTAFKLTRNGSKWMLQVLHRFCTKAGCPDGDQPLSPLIVDTAGNLYGTTMNGGTFNYGVVFELSPPSGDKTKWSYRKLHEFCGDCSDGSEPRAGLSYAGADSGKPYDGVSALYGTTYAGGVGEYPVGTVFQIKPHGARKWRETVLHSFCSEANCADGAAPYAGVLVTSSGALLGTTAYGGMSDIDSGPGVVFQLTKTGKIWSETILHTFCSSDNCGDGVHPVSGLFEDAQGNLFGTTLGGDYDSHGNVFELVPNGTQSQLTVLHTYCGDPDCGDGNAPWGGLIADGNGGLYGTTEWGGGHDGDYDAEGGGTAFQLIGTTENILYSFCALDGEVRCADGAYPLGSLLRDGKGNLYGTTSTGGSNSGSGTVFELTR